VRRPFLYAVSAPLYSAQFYLGVNQIGDAGAAELAKALASNDTLTEVCMARHGLPHAVPAPFGSAQLYLSGNQIGAFGAAELAKALAANGTLIQVRVAWHGACAMGRDEGHTTTSDATPIAPCCAYYYLLGTAQPQR